jgi:cytochrome bd-type quinol oxidase subunit 2
MSSGGVGRTLPWVALGLAVALFVGWAVAPASALYAEILSPHRLLGLAAVLKLVYLLAGTAWAFACRDRLEAGNPARPAWFLLSLGLLSTFAGQLCLAPLQVVQGETPFPSMADIFFVISYPFLIAALLVLLNAYREAGFPIGSVAERAAILAGVGVIAAVVAVPILRPVAAVGGPLLERILTVAYPVLDLVLLLPLALLLRVALSLRGSHAGEVWALLLGGFVFLCAGDICFAWFQSLGEEHLDPFVHANFVLAYGLVAGGAHRQLQLLKT